MRGPCKHILAVVELFASEAHSGFSAAYASGVLTRLLRYEPLTPLTGEPDEWQACHGYGAHDLVYQNRRCSHVFKDATGAYDAEGRVFREPDGSCYTTRDSHVPITFPYTPKRQYFDVESAE